MRISLTRRKQLLTRRWLKSFKLIQLKAGLTSWKDKIIITFIELQEQTSKTITGRPRAAPMKRFQTCQPLLTLNILSPNMLNLNMQLLNTLHLNHPWLTTWPSAANTVTIPAWTSDNINRPNQRKVSRNPVTQNKRHLEVREDITKTRINLKFIKLLCIVIESWFEWKLKVKM